MGFYDDLLDIFVHFVAKIFYWAIFPIVQRLKIFD